LRELALHVLDLVENSIRAGAGVVAVTVEEQPERNLLAIAVEDDGPGLVVNPEQATDPFYTTKEGKRTGLGLSLFRFQVEQAGGALELGRSALGGLAVRATLQLGHVDRHPLGDLASTLAGVVAANPGVEVCVELRVGDRDVRVSSAFAAGEVARGRGGAARAAARRLRQEVAEGMASLHMSG